MVMKVVARRSFICLLLSRVYLHCSRASSRKRVSRDNNDDRLEKLYSCCKSCFNVSAGCQYCIETHRVRILQMAYHTDLDGRSITTLTQTDKNVRVQQKVIRALCCMKKAHNLTKRIDETAQSAGRASWHRGTEAVGETDQSLAVLGLRTLVSKMRTTPRRSCPFRRSA